MPPNDWRKRGGWKVEVIDIRSLIPLDKEAIFESVKKTSKALVVHEDKVFSGFGAELAAMIGEEMFRYLDGPVQRVGSTFTPVGFNPILEKEILPDEAKIYEAALEIIGILKEKNYEKDRFVFMLPKPKERVGWQRKYRKSLEKTR